ncbi:hypothetical protein FIV42_16685 [Persicimonas caeni]|uniref:Uncharacterized protein n=1 Tax=Persicimonas caeni TaxID=2292766 RepID=A0A4Y6PVD1_PERCE|nr:hypothetical protein [Persicimonas caeni]QDG52314.1 hypothetical protein FIV42_16685 [Persicimonas caeni]QED33536.1 hypothetical protein FRD00_16680 [Persicimonas caeni]
MQYSIAKAWRSFVPVGLVCLLATANACSPAEDAPGGESSTANGRIEALSQANPVCGLDVLPSPARPAEDPCTAGELILDGPLAASTSWGDSSRDTFHLTDASRVCIRVDGAFGARVHVDGTPVMPRPREAGSSTTNHFALELDAGTHHLSLHGADEVEVRASRIRPGQVTVMGQNGIVELTNVAVDHPMFSPNGDDYHDTALFNADNFPWYLPGEYSGYFDYYLDWEWEVIDAQTCQSYGVVLDGATQVNSPTNVQALWDGSDPQASTSVQALGSSNLEGPAISDGSYIYQYRADLMRSDGLWLDTVVSYPHGVLVNSQSSRWPNSFGGTGPLSVNSLSNAKFISACDPNTDPYSCLCPAQLEEGTRCTAISSVDLATFDDPNNLPQGFISSTYDSATDRWTVVADMRTFNGGGLIPQTNGDWATIGELQQFVSDLTGVPVDSTSDRLFNFDYIQLGYSTPVHANKPVVGFNHFLLDVISDHNGAVTIGSTTYDVPTLFANGGPNTPAAYDIGSDRDGDECYHNGNTNGTTEIEARSCTELRMANLDPGASNVGIYRIKTRIFEMLVDGQGTTREYSCNSSGTECLIRSYQRDAEAIKLTREHYYEDGSNLLLGPSPTRSYTDLPMLIVETDRYFDDNGQDSSYDGVCSRGELTRDSMEIPLDSADGALPSTCIVNGTF